MTGQLLHNAHFSSRHITLQIKLPFALARLGDFPCGLHLEQRVHLHPKRLFDAQCAGVIVFDIVTARFRQ